MLSALRWGMQILSRCIKKFGVLTGFRIFLKLYARLPSAGKKVETINFNFYGKLLVARIGTSDTSVFHSVFLNEEYNLAFLHPHPKLIIDIGANVGYASIFFAHSYPQARVFAVEPEDGNFQMLVQNTKLYENIVPIHAAVWHKKGRVRIENLNAEKWAFQVSEPSNEMLSVTVDALTVDDLLAMSGEDTIDILKIDIEGAEIELCGKNYENWLRKTSIIVIELHDRLRKGCSETFNGAISSYNFQRFQRGENTILWARK